MGIKAFNHGDDFVNKFVKAIAGDSTGLDAVTPAAAGGSGLTATGGIISDYTSGSDVYRAHIFTSSGTFTVTDNSSDFGTDIEYLVVAGGGAGGSGAYRLCGGGGAGGLLSNHPDVPASSPTGATRQAAYPVSTGSYTVSIGAGGAGATNGTIVDGSASNFYPTPVSHPSPTYIRAVGGGGGGGNPDPGSNGGSNTSGNPGGSGGGNTESGSTSFSIGGGGSGTPGQGSNGGRTGSGLGAGGGGGAGEAGCQDDNGPIPSNPPGAYTNGGYGGDGMQVRIAGSPSSDQPVGTPGTNPGGGYFAGGGGGSYQPSTNAPLKGIGGEGGGGYGVIWPGSVNPFGQDGLTSTGGGGGGAAAQTGPSRGGNGGSGVVVVRYQIGTVNTGDAKASGGAISFYNNKTIHTFTSTGDFTNTSGSPLTVEYIAIAGGGSGSRENYSTGTAGGGGAGGVISNIPGFMPGTTAIPAVGPGSPNKLTVTIGAGGAGFSGSSAGNDGVNSTIVGPGPISITANGGGGGGGGGSDPTSPGRPGGSSGGSSRAVAAGPATQGNAGGQGYGPSNSNAYGGGGGGAGGAGGGSGNIDDPAPNNYTVGGDGVRLPSTFHDPRQAPGPGTTPITGGGLGTPGPAGGFYLAGGGGGSSYRNPGNPYSQVPNASNRPNGGFGGGGSGAYYPGTPDSENGVVSTGGGGGAMGNGAPTSVRTGSGGSGLVLIAYPT